MENKYVIEIKVNDEKGASAPTGNSEATNAATAWKNSDIAKGAKLVSSFYGATSLARSAVHAGVGLMSVQTGNQLEQQRVSTTIGLIETGITTGLMFAMNPVAGITYSAGQAISFAAEAERNAAQINKQAMSANYVRERAGGAFNRSRNTGSF